MGGWGGGSGWWCVGGEGRLPAAPAPGPAHSCCSCCAAAPPALDRILVAPPPPPPPLGCMQAGKEAKIVHYDPSSVELAKGEGFPFR